MSFNKYSIDRRSYSCLLWKNSFHMSCMDRGLHLMNSKDITAFQGPKSIRRSSMHRKSLQVFHKNMPQNALWKKYIIKGFCRKMTLPRTSIEIKHFHYFQWKKGLLRSSWEERPFQGLLQKESAF